jgi:hypothetical protein
MGTDLMKSVKHTGNIPAKDLDLKDLNPKVVAAWRANPQITLVGTTPDQLETDSNAFDAELSQRITVGGGRSQVSNALAKLDTLMNNSVGYLKGYLNDEVGKDAAPSYYPQFGFEKVGSAYTYPRDRNKRSEALKQTLLAIDSLGFGAKKYGTTFWQAIKTEYDDLLIKAATTDGTVAGKVASKNQLRAGIVKTHNSLIHAIRANYPDTWKAIIREWGFQKEKY